jgi:hypothetical protein
MIKSRRMRWAEHVACMREIINACKVFVGKPEVKRSLGSPGQKKYNIKIRLKETGWDDVGWINLAEDRDQWRDLVNTVVNLRVQP